MLHELWSSWISTGLSIVDGRANQYQVCGWRARRTVSNPPQYVGFAWTLEKCVSNSPLWMARRHAGNDVEPYVCDLSAIVRRCGRPRRSGRTGRDGRVAAPRAPSSAAAGPAEIVSKTLTSVMYRPIGCADGFRIGIGKTSYDPSNRSDSFIQQDREDSSSIC
jgi:hypothetical protein